jgi:hypothetical protein
MTRKEIVIEARKIFPGHAMHVRTIGGVKELVVSELRDPTKSLTAPVVRRRYNIVPKDDGYEFVEYKGS